MYSLILCFIYLTLPQYILSSFSKQPSSDPSRFRRRLTSARPNSCDLSLSLGRQIQQRATNTPRSETDPEFNIAKNINSIVSAELLTYNRKPKKAFGASSSNNKTSVNIVPTLDLKQTLQHKKILGMCYRSLGFLQLAKKRHPEATNIDREISITINHIMSLDPTAQEQKVPKSARNNSGREELWKNLVQKKEASSSTKIHRKTRRKKSTPCNDKRKGNRKRKKSKQHRTIPKISLERLAFSKDVQTALCPLKRVAAHKQQQTEQSIKIHSREKNTLLKNLARISQKPVTCEHQKIFIHSTYKLIDTALSLTQNQLKKESPRRFLISSPRKHKYSTQLKHDPKLCQYAAELVLPTFDFMAEYYTLESNQTNVSILLNYMQKALDLIKEIESSGYTIIKSTSTARSIECCITIAQERHTPCSQRRQDIKLLEMHSVFLETVRMILKQHKAIIDPGHADDLYDRWNHPTHISKKIMVTTAVELLTKTQRCDDLVKLNTAIARIPSLNQHPKIKPLIAKTTKLLRQNAHANQKIKLSRQSPRKQK